MTTLLGFDRPQDLYEFANGFGIHAGSMSKLSEFAIEIQRLALARTTTNEEKEETE
jgi:hypothetical protein